MSRDIKNVRKSIEQRKKGRNPIAPVGKEQPFLFHDTEEKHGFPPDISGNIFKKQESSDRLAPFIMKGILAGILFFAAALLMHTDNDLLAKPQAMASNLLQNEFPFAKVNVWYQDVFGSPLAFSPQTESVSTGDNERIMPVSGDITETFQANGTGVKISPGKEADVFAHQEGVVVFAGSYPDTEKTIVVQHADGTDSSYGYLSEVEVHLYQYVTTNQRIGKFSPKADNEAVFFSLEKDRNFIDPVQVIEVDDVP